MFYHYEIKNNGFEDILYLFLDMKYEIANELISDNLEDLGRRTRNFIHTNDINFKGKKVYLVIDGVVVKSVDISKYDITKVDNNYFSQREFNVNIILEDHSVCEMSLYDFLICILLYYHRYNLHDEVLKSLGILFTTYVYKVMKENNCINVNDKYIHFKPLSFYEDSISNYKNLITKISNIIEEIDSMFLKYNDLYILPFIHLCNNGKTVGNKNYPYLSSVISTWDIASKYYIKIRDFSFTDFSNRLNTSFDISSKIEVFKKDNNRYISINGIVYTIYEFQNKLDLLSDDIFIIIYNNYIRIITRGCGNFYGLSIVGAEEIAKNGGKYYNILNYYFPKVKLYKYKKELS